MTNKALNEGVLGVGIVTRGGEFTTAGVEIVTRGGEFT